MKHNKITALVLALTLTAGVLSGCDASTEPEMSFVDVAELNNSPLPSLTTIQFGENKESSGDTSSETDNSDSTSGTQSANTDSVTSTENSPNSASTSQSGEKSAEIVIPTAAEYNVCTAEFSVLDPEKVKSALLGNVEVTPEIRDFSADDPYYKYPNYDWTIGSTTLSLDNNNSFVQLSGDLSALIRYIIYLPKENSDGNVNEFEHRNDDLDFCTREQAVKNVKDILAKMDVAVSDNADVYAFHQDDLQKHINGRIAEQRFYDPQTSPKDTTAKPLTSYTVDKSQECYYIVFNEEHGNVPIYNQHFGYLTITDLVIFHPEILAIYSSEGLVGLYISEYRGNISDNEKITQVITAESAAQAVAAKYAGVAGVKQVEFDKLELMYVITPGIVDGKINVLKAKMIPAWVCTVRYTQWTTDRNTKDYGYVASKKTVMIDAQTGAEII